MKDWAGILPFVLIAVVFWLLMIRPARKRQQKMTATQNSVRVGSDVMLSSGIYGTVTSVDDDTLHLEISPGSSLKVARQAVVRVVEPSPATDDPVAEPTQPTHGQVTEANGVIEEQ